MPDFLIIGAKRCGTTSLYNYFLAHPEIWMSAGKEINFFNLQRNWEKGLDWYGSHFQSEKKCAGEASPGYAMEHRYPGSAARVFQNLPNVKLIYLVRDPLQAIVSHYLHLRFHGWTVSPLSELLVPDDPTGLLRTHRYHDQASAYLKFFRREQLLVVDSESLKRRRTQTLSGVFRFLGVDPSFVHKDFKKTWNRSEGRVFPDLKVSLLHRRTSDLPLQEGVLRVLRQRIQRPRLTGLQKSFIADYLKDDTGKFKSLFSELSKGGPTPTWLL